MEKNKLIKLRKLVDKISIIGLIVFTAILFEICIYLWGI
jgi:hypothetical protein